MRRAPDPTEYETVVAIPYRTDLGTDHVAWAGRLGPQGKIP